MQVYHHLIGNFMKNKKKNTKNSTSWVYNSLAQPGRFRKTIPPHIRREKQGFLHRYQFENFTQLF